MTLLFLPSYCFDDVKAAETRADRELLMAENAILSSLMRSSSPAGRYFCSQQPLCCLGPDRAELGLSLIAAKRGPKALSSLAGIARFRIDAGLAEDYTCYVLSAGKRILPYLSSQDNKTLTEKCAGEFNSIKSEQSNEFDGLSESAVCANYSKIQERVQSLIKAINAGQLCARDNF